MLVKRLIVAALLVLGTSQAAMAAEPKPLHLVVMDPLALPLSCPCVEGYAQRDYDKLGAYLSKKLGREVTVGFSESLVGAMKKYELDTVHIVIGKDSVVRADAAKKKLKVEPVAQLTGKDGSTTQTGLIVVRSADSAKNVFDLSGYRILYGPAECAEKFAAPRAMLTDAGIAVVDPDKAETSAACSDGAVKILEWGDSEQAAAVISSYAAPLLEGCGTVKKGDLRVVAETKPVPFVTAFINTDLPEADQKTIREALVGVMDEPELMLALETLQGFVPLTDEYQAYHKKDGKGEKKSAEEKPANKLGATSLPAYESEVKTMCEGPPGEGPPAATAWQSTHGWTGWRGPHRNGRVRALPTSLPEKLTAVWEIPLAHAGLGGIMATEKYVVIGDRNLPNTGDEFRCYDAATGDLVWMVDYDAPGKLDYDNTPRATPLVIEGDETQLLGTRAILLGAFGHLSCVDLETGLLFWQHDIREQYGVESEMVWGTCGSPLMAGGKVIVNPGGPQASLVGIDPALGMAEWQTPGESAGYGSFMVGTFGGRQQIVGHDRTSLGGWDITTGERLWTMKPPREGDFNVPTPIEIDDKLLVATEGNGTRLYEFDDAGNIIPEPIAVQAKLAPDMSTPVVVGRRAYCVVQRLFCLDLDNGLQQLWTLDDPAFCDYAPLIADENRLLVLGRGGELILIDIAGDKPKVVSRTKLFDDEATEEAELYSHPAITGNRLYVRGERSLACFELPMVDEGSEAKAE